MIVQFDRRGWWRCNPCREMHPAGQERCYRCGARQWVQRFLRWVGWYE